MPIIAFQGNLGTGKTLFMTALALALTNQIESNIYTNYDFDPVLLKKRFPRVTHFKIDDYTDLRLLVEQGGGILCFDEFQMIVDSRMFSNNVFVTQFSMFLRKFGTSLFYTTQHISFVDLRLRLVTDYLFDSKKRENTHVYTLYRLLDGKKLKVIELTKEQLSYCYNIYDTLGIIFPMPFPKKPEEFTGFLKELDRLNRQKHSLGFNPASLPSGGVQGSV